MIKGNKKNRRKEKIWLKITYTELEKLFGAPRKTIQTWIAKNRLDPTHLLDIIQKYNDQSLLFRRKSRTY